LSAVSAGNEKPKQMGKLPEIRKMFSLEVLMTLLWKI